MIMEKRLELLPRLLMTTVTACLVTSGRAESVSPPTLASSRRVLSGAMVSRVIIAGTLDRPLIVLLQKHGDD
jgi:hypothetical protein